VHVAVIAGENGDKKNTKVEIDQSYATTHRLVHVFMMGGMVGGRAAWMGMLNTFRVITLSIW
jgi:hypothetical protein